MLWPIKNFEKHFMAHQYMPKFFHKPHKIPLAPPPTYLMYGALHQQYKSNIKLYLRNFITMITCQI